MVTDLSDKIWDTYYDPDPGGFDRPDEAVRFDARAWDEEIAEIDRWVVPVVPAFKLHGCIPIDDAPGFVAREMEVVRAQRGNPTFRPYLDRVKAVRVYIECKRLRDATGVGLMDARRILETRTYEEALEYITSGQWYSDQRKAGML